MIDRCWRRPRRWHPERGQVGGIEAVPFGLLVFVVGTLLVASTWAVVDAKLTVTAAAREGARAAVESDSARAAAANADRAAREAVASSGLTDPVDVTVRTPASFQRCGAISVRVSTTLPAVPLPWIGGIGSITVAAHHAERIDPYRDGLPGGGACPP